MWERMCACVCVCLKSGGLSHVAVELEGKPSSFFFFVSVDSFTHLPDTPIPTRADYDICKMTLPLSTLENIAVPTLRLDGC